MARAVAWTLLLKDTGWDRNAQTAKPGGMDGRARCFVATALPLPRRVSVTSDGRGRTARPSASDPQATRALGTGCVPTGPREMVLVSALRAISDRTAGFPARGRKETRALVTGRATGFRERPVL